MATYSASTSATTLRSGAKFSTDGEYDTHVRTRAYMKFDLSSYGLTLAQIDSAVLRMYVKTIYQSAGGGTSGPHELWCGTSGDNWGTTLQANSADFQSTAVYQEDEQTISSTGSMLWTVDKSHLNLSGITYFKIRLDGTVECAENYEYVDWYSQNDGTASRRPALCITLVSGRRIFVVT